MTVKRKMNSTTQLVLDMCWLQYDWLYLICLALFHLQSFQILLRIPRVPGLLRVCFLHNPHPKYSHGLSDMVVIPCSLFTCC